MAEQILNINLDKGRRKRFTIDGDENRVLEINPSDMGIFARLSEFDEQVTAAMEKFSNEQAEVTTDEDFDIVKLGKLITELDHFIREKMDWLFDTNVSEVMAPHGTMLDPINGEFRFQYLNEVLSDLFDKQFTKELKIRNDTIRKHTKKYVDKVNKV